MAAPPKLQTTAVPVAQLRLNDTVSPSPFSVRAIAFTSDNRTMAVSGDRSPDIFVYRQNIDAGMVLVRRFFRDWSFFAVSDSLMELVCVRKRFDEHSYPHSSHSSFLIPSRSTN